MPTPPPTPTRATLTPLLGCSPPRRRCCRAPPSVHRWRASRSRSSRRSRRSSSSSRSSSSRRCSRSRSRRGRRPSGRGLRAASPLTSCRWRRRQRRRRRRGRRRRRLLLLLLRRRLLRRRRSGHRRQRSTTAAAAAAAAAAGAAAAATAAAATAAAAAAPAAKRPQKATFDHDGGGGGGGGGGVVPAERCFVRIETVVQKRPFSLGAVGALGAARTEPHAHTGGPGPVIGDLVHAAPRPPVPAAAPRTNRTEQNRTTGAEQRVDAEGNLVTSVRRPFSLRR